MAEYIKFHKNKKSSLPPKEKKFNKFISKAHEKIFAYSDVFIDLVDACGIYAYYVKMHARYPDNSYYQFKADTMIDEIDRYTVKLAKRAKAIGWKIGRREKLADMLIGDKERRKVYKSYLVRYLKKNSTLSLDDLEMKYQNILIKRETK